MKIDKTECPGCNAEQSFRPRWRYLMTEPGMIEVYIACSVCPWSKVLRTSTHEIETLRRRLMRHHKQAARQTQFFGAPAAHTQVAINQLTHQLAQAEARLREV
jgi:hypothetical protein